MGSCSGSLAQSQSSGMSCRAQAQPRVGNSHRLLLRGKPPLCIKPHTIIPPRSPASVSTCTAQRLPPCRCSYRDTQTPKPVVELDSEGNPIESGAAWEIPGSSTEKWNGVGGRRGGDNNGFSDEEKDREDSRRYRRTVRRSDPKTSVRIHRSTITHHRSNFQPCECVRHCRTHQPTHMLYTALHLSAHQYYSLPMCAY